MEGDGGQWRVNERRGSQWRVIMSRNYNGLFAWNVFEDMMIAIISSQFRINKIIKDHAKRSVCWGI